MRKQSDSQYCVTRFALRTKLIDDQVLAALSDSKISEDQPETVRQVVVLGAGMDTRAWRMDLPEGVVHLQSCLEHAGTWDVSHHVQQEKQGKTVGSNEHRVCNAPVSHASAQ